MPSSLGIFNAKWNALVNQWVHAPKTTVLAGNSAWGGGIDMGPPGSNLGGGIKMPPSSSNPAGVNAATGLKVPLRGVRTPVDPKRTMLESSIPISTLRILWVEAGVIWPLPNLLVGFTSYAALTAFFSSVKSLG